MAEVEDEPSTQLSTLLPSAEVQQAENKAWQDVFDTPANRSAETVGMLLDVRHGCVGPGSRLDSAVRTHGMYSTHAPGICPRPWPFGCVHS